MVVLLSLHCGRMIGNLFFSCGEIEVGFRFVNSVHPGSVFLSVGIAPILGLYGLAFEGSFLFEAKSHPQISIRCIQIGVEMLIGKIQGVSDIGKAMIVFIGRKIFGEIKGQILQAKQVPHGVAVFPPI